MKPVRITAEDMDTSFFYSIKKHLMRNDEKIQIRTVEELLNIMNSKSNQDREKIVMALIRCDVVTILFDLVPTARGRSFSYLLDTINLLSECSQFYEDPIAAQAVNSILKLSYCLLKYQTNKRTELEKLTLIIGRILHKGIERGVRLNTICSPQQAFTFVVSLFAKDDKKLRLPATTLLNIVLENITVDEGSDVHVFSLCKKAISAMKEFLDYSDEDSTHRIAMTNLCATCAFGARFCIMENDSTLEISDNMIEQKRNVTEAIYDAMMKIIIPYVKATNLSDSMRIKFLRNFITGLNNIYKLQNCDRHKLSNYLATNGYLKYFLKLMTEFPDTLRQRSCLLLARIMNTLTENIMSLDSWPGNVTGFSDLLYHGLSKLPNDLDLLSQILTEQTKSGIALLILFYYHYLGTRETDMISFQSLVKRTMTIQSTFMIPRQVLKALWLLFAVTYNLHSAPHSEEGYLRAVKQLAGALRQANLDDCYTHHVNLMEFCLKCPEFPSDLQGPVMDLWLIESEGMIEPLLDFNYEKVLQHFLIIALKSNRPKEIIDLVVIGLRKLMKVDNSGRIGTVAWEMLPNLLSSYIRNQSNDNVTAVLELTTLSSPSRLTVSTVQHCADKLIDIILTAIENLELKSLAIIQAYVLLNISITNNVFSVINNYVNEKFLVKFCSEIFLMKDFRLLAISLELLTLIVQSHQKHTTEFEFSVSIDVKDYKKLLIEARTFPHALKNGLICLHELLTQNLESSVFKLKELPNKNGDSVEFVNLYEILIHMIHGRIKGADKNLVYQCLADILNYCHENKRKLMYDLSSTLSNCTLVTDIFEDGTVGDSFLNYTSVWLRYHKYFFPDEAPWNPRSLCKSPFDEALDKVREYLNTVEETSLNSIHFNLRYAVKQFDE